MVGPRNMLYFLLIFLCSYWTNPDKIDSVEHLSQIEHSLRESLNQIRAHKVVSRYKSFYNANIVLNIISSPISSLLCKRFCYLAGKITKTAARDIRMQ